LFETLFTYRGVQRRHQEGRAADERERFLRHCADQGMARNTLQHIAQELLVIADCIDVTAGQTVGLRDIEAFAARWAREQQRRHRAQELRWSRGLFVQTATRWFQFLGRLDQPEPKPMPLADSLGDFVAHSTSERGLSPATVRNRYWHVQKFVHWLNDQRGPFHLNDVSLKDIHDFLAWGGQHGWSRVSVATSAKALRAFFRYAGGRGWCASTIAGSIDGPRVFQHEGLPVGPAWGDVQRLIAAASDDQARDVRDRAILMLLATYGLRSGEVAKMCLEDVDWHGEVLRIARPKQRRAQQYPLTEETGEAILQYLQKARPHCGRREIFLTLKAPVRPLSPGALYHLVSSRLSELALSLPHRGPHALRHACAGHLVAEGFSLKQIGDHLGHRSAYATRIYAKVDLAGLREVADFDLGGLR
jgi:site-specific recombinase XerD